MRQRGGPVASASVSGASCDGEHEAQSHAQLRTVLLGAVLVSEVQLQHEQAVMASGCVE